MEAEDKQTVETPEQSVQQPDVNADATGQAVETETVARSEEHTSELQSQR